MVVRAAKTHVRTAQEIETYLTTRKRLQARMRAFRKAHGITVDESNGLISLRPSTSWYRIETYIETKPNFETLCKIAVAMGLEVWELLAPLPGEENSSSSGT